MKRKTKLASSPLKGAGVVGTKIEKGHLEYWQELVDGLRDSFVAAVARGRGMDLKTARSLAQGRVWLAPEAMALGLIDAVENEETALAVGPAGREEEAMFGRKKRPGQAGSR